MKRQQSAIKSDDSTPQANKARQMLLQLRENFVNELPARIENLEQLLLNLQRAEDFNAQFGQLLRETHSLKGAGGSYGLPFVTSVCHHLEEAYSGIDASQCNLSASLLNHLLEYIDILKDALSLPQNENDFSGLETRLHGLKEKRVSGISALLISSSRSVQELCRSALNDEYPIEWRNIDDGYEALGLLLQEHFDFIVMSNELARLSGEAVIAAVRLSAGINRHTPVVLVSSSPSLRLPAEFRANYTVKRDGQLLQSLPQALLQVVGQMAA